jgi:glyoxylase-like metal-dependent hydrolase (beta-lactamase superfamily II)
VPASIENLKQRLAAATKAEEKAYYQEMIAQSQAFLEEMRDVAVELPNVTFEDNLVLHDKAHDVHLAFRGRGHTAGDIVAFCPQKKVVASGDLFHGFFPVLGDGYPRDWPGTLNSIAQFPFEIVAGGHGGVQRSTERMRQLRSYLEELIETVGRARQEGIPLERLQQTVTPSSLKTLTQGGYGDYLAGEVKRLDFRVQMITSAEVMARGVRDNVTAVYRNWDRA